MKYLKIIVPFLVFFLFLMAFEYISFLYLSSTNEQVQATESSNPVWQNIQGMESYTELDPLLGWAISKRENSDYNHVEIANSFVLATVKMDCDDVIKIYISGGSTSDIMFDSNNWPRSLIQLLEAQNTCAEIYIAAVAGYSSGQELLKLIRDIDEIKPDFHISYSGVNETGNSSYVSDYEINNYERMIGGSRILPNSIRVLEKVILKKPSYVIRYPEKREASDFWVNNMEIMHGMAASKEYTFIGILQPVFKFREHLNNSENETLHYFANEYIQFYPAAQEHIKTQKYLYDFSDFFNNSSEVVFKDDCHLNDVKHQNKVAEGILKLLNLGDR